MSKQITELTRDEVKALRTEIEKALATVTKKTGVEFEIGNIRFNSNDGKAPITFKAAVPKGKAKEVKAAEGKEALATLKTWLKMHGLKATCATRPVILRGNKYNIVEYKKRSPKYPFIGLRDGTNDRYKLSVRDLEEAGYGTK